MRFSKDRILETINKNELDVRKTHDARWIDQKCTPDVVSAVADIVDTIYHENLDGEESTRLLELSSKDVWFSEYAQENIVEMFNKSNPRSEKAIAEYNKFYQQPLNLLAYAGILKKSKRGRTNVYSIIDSDLLAYIGMSDRNALRFLIVYIQQVLTKSGLYLEFLNFLNTQTSESYNNLKEKFENFCFEFTKINKKLEPDRIFPKILNPLAESKGKLGSKRGQISKQPITYTELMYNNVNFRDIWTNKPKNITRQEWLKNNPIEKSQKAKFNADSTRAKKYVRRFNDMHFNGNSELDDKLSQGKAINMHHIFPANEFREISGYTENIIAITPTQHYNEAHVLGNTKRIDLDIQELLLKAKANTIKIVTSHKEWDQIYTFDNFAHVLHVGFNSDEPEENYNDFDSVINEINAYYSVIN